MPKSEQVEETEELVDEQEAGEILDAASEPDYETLAKAEGWNPDGELDAREFYERGQKILPIVNAKNRRLEKRLEAMEREYKQFASMATKKNEELRKENERLAKLKMAQAEEEGDAIAYVKAQNELKEAQRAPENVPREVPPQVREWEARHPEYRLNADGSPSNEFTAIVNGLADLSIATVGSNAPVDVFLDDLDRRMYAHFKKAKPARSVESSRPSKKTSKKGYDALPSDAKAACDRFVKSGKGTQEQWVGFYDWSEE